jgi:L-cysteate sulfo-lyase
MLCGVRKREPPARKVDLGTWPTPLEPAPRLAEALGLRPDDLWIKRDDLTGLGGGGNKVRKLEYTCGAALGGGAQVLVTTGAAQSNHARLTAAAGARLGLEVLLVLRGRPPAIASGNVALDWLFGASVEWAGELSEGELQNLARHRAEMLTKSGKRAELIPFGGSSVLAAQGYVDCGHELASQAPDLDHVVVAVGSGATMAGLVHALGSELVQGIDTGAVADPESRVRALLTGLVGEVSRASLQIRREQVGDGYSSVTEGAQWALQVAALSEGILLDPIYTGRALAGLAAAVRDGTIRAGQRTVLLHSGGTPALFGDLHPVTLTPAPSRGRR